IQLLRQTFLLRSFRAVLAEVVFLSGVLFLAWLVSTRVERGQTQAKSTFLFLDPLRRRLTKWVYALHICTTDVSGVKQAAHEAFGQSPETPTLNSCATSQAPDTQSGNRPMHAARAQREPSLSEHLVLSNGDGADLINAIGPVLVNRFHGDGHRIQTQLQVI